MKQWNSLFPKASNGGSSVLATLIVIEVESRRNCDPFERVMVSKVEP
jgi:hypothetical protein